MPLTPSQKVALALRLTAARCYDPSCSYEDDEGRRAIRHAAWGALHSRAVDASLEVRDEEHIFGYIESCLATLEPYILRDQALAEGKILLERYAGALADGCGDGRVYGNDIAIHRCQTGILELAHLLDVHARDSARSAAVDLRDEPELQFTTSFVTNSSLLLPFRVYGQADISLLPRQIDISFADEALSGNDILMAAYVILHELICHGFQRCLSRDPAKNAAAKCHWSEGWMDALAFDLAKEWVWTGPSEWVPMRADTGVTALRKMHDHRYSEGSRLPASDVMRRICARDGYRYLKRRFLELGMASSSDDAQNLVHRFSWTLQTHEEFDAVQMRGLALRIARILASMERAEDHVVVADACLSFIGDRDLVKLNSTVPLT